MIARIRSIIGGVFVFVGMKLLGIERGQESLFEGDDDIEGPQPYPPVKLSPEAVSMREAAKKTARPSPKKNTTPKHGSVHERIARARE